VGGGGLRRSLGRPGERTAREKGREKKTREGEGRGGNARKGRGTAWAEGVGSLEKSNCGRPQ